MFSDEEMGADVLMVAEVAEMVVGVEQAFAVVVVVGVEVGEAVAVAVAEGVVVEEAAVEGVVVLALVDGFHVRRAKSL